MDILINARDRYFQKMVPMQATLELTYRCNERCGHCYLSTYNDADDGRPPLSLDEWKQVLDELADAGTMMLVLIGGEAMMHPYFWEITDYASQKNFAVSLISNGLLINEKAADRMADLGFYQVTVSLYSLDSQTHDKMTRRKGSHQMTMAAIERLVVRGIQVGVNCLLTKDSIDGALDLEAWARQHKIKVAFDPMVTAKNDGSLESTHHRASAEQMRQFYRGLKQRGRGPRPNAELGPDDPVCNAGRGKCAVNAYGDLLTCLEIRDSLGNLREQSFKTLWASDKANEQRGLTNKELDFDPNCGDGKFCDHCQGMSQAESGDPAKSVPFITELAQIKREVYEEP